VATGDVKEGSASDESRKGGLGYQAALDGVRAVGILSVLLYHGGVGWAQGGFLGVEAFFVLSGFLITSLLLAEWRRDKTIKLSNFWARRARRLLPALFCVVAAVGIYQAVAGASKAVPDLFNDGLATLFYVGNWHQIWTGSGYFANTGPVSPLQHTWSLAIEEQFYLIWPLVVLAVLKLGKNAGDARVKVLMAVAVVGSVGSCLEMWWLFHGGSGLNRVYYGTDTRAQGLLAGAALACGLAWWRGRRSLAEQPVATDDGVGQRAKVVFGTLGLLGTAGILWAMHVVGNAASSLGGTSSGLYSGGMLAFDAATVAVIASVSLAPKAPVAWLLSTWPMRSVGKISYGLYLWHWPLFLWLTQQTTGLAGFELFALRIGASLGVATTSYFLIEQPIRQRRWSVKTIRSLAPVGVAAALAALVLAANVAPVSASGGGPQGTDNPGSSTTTTTIAVKTGPVSWLGTQHCQVHPAVPGGNKYPPAQYQTCPPVRVALLGDSMALTLGYGLGSEQRQYGVLMADDAQLGCSFGVKGLGNWGNGSNSAWGMQNIPCLTQFRTWQQQLKSFKPAAIVVMMGYWDCYDRLWNGKDVHIGEPVFDAYLHSQMVKFVRMEGLGDIPIVFLTVPYVDPPALQDGSEPSAASVVRHNEIDAMLSQLAAQFPKQVYVVNSDKYLSPGNHFDSKVNGRACRWSDGVHFYPYCGALMAPSVLSLVRQLVAARGGPGPSYPHHGTATTTSSPAA
jgi:peptidoglycan/LPS O-acetylase OafA/YrhL